MRTFPVTVLPWLLLAALMSCPLPGRAADPLVDSAVVALAQLTDPHRLEQLPEGDFRAQLGPALGWLHVARRRDVSPEAVIARALARNGLEGERARLTREALLRNLARADAWELFDYADSARALSDGKPAPIPAGIHRGHLAQAAVILPEGLRAWDRREFACLVLRADDEEPTRAPRGSHRRQPGDMLARNDAMTSPQRPVGPPPAGVAVVRAAPTAPAAPAAPTAPLVPPVDDEGPLPVLYTASGNESGKVAVREEVSIGQEISLAALGGPACRFVLRGADGGSVRFDLIGDEANPAEPAREFALPLAQGNPTEGKARVWRIYEGPGGLRISLYDAAPVTKDGVRTVLFEFPPTRREATRETR